MTAFSSELDSYLVHRILIIDPEREERDRLAGILASIKGITPDGIFDEASVENLSKAREYINARTPSIVLIAPEIDSTSTVLSFIEENRVSHPTIIWVINSKAGWWSANNQAVQDHPFGDRVINYYRRSKSTSPDEAKRSFLITLALCQNDFVLQLLDKTAMEIRTEAGQNMTDEQIRKFAKKGIPLLLSLLAKDQTVLESNERLAFVSMPFKEPYKSRYHLAIKPTLVAFKYTPRFMEDEYCDRPIPLAILGSIFQSSLFVVDITEPRPDVMIELGAALIAKIPVIFLANHKVLRDPELPFMLRGTRIEYYESDLELEKQFRAAIASPRIPFSTA